MLTSSRKSLGMIEFVPHCKIGLQLLCGRIDTMKNLFFNSKLDLFLVLKAKYWILHPKKYKGANGHEDWPYRTQVITISLNAKNSKWWISKQCPKITQILKADILGTV